MNENLKADLLASYTIFVHDFADPNSASKTDLEDKIKSEFKKRNKHMGVDNFELKDLFSRQMVADFAKKSLGEDFKKAVALYFDRYRTKDGINHHLLLRDLDQNETALTLHLKKDAVRYVRLLAQVLSVVDAKPKGLLI